MSLLCRADHVPIVELNNALKTAKSLLGHDLVKVAMDACFCDFCNNPLSEKAFNGISSLKKLLLCDEVIHEDLSYRPPRSSISREDAQKQNEEWATKKIRTDKMKLGSTGRALTNPHKSVRLQKAIKNTDFLGNFSIEPYKCAYWTVISMYVVVLTVISVQRTNAGYGHVTIACN